MERYKSLFTEKDSTPKLKRILPPELYGKEFMNTNRSIIVFKEDSITIIDGLGEQKTFRLG